MIGVAEDRTVINNINHAIIIDILAGIAAAIIISISLAGVGNIRAIIQIGDRRALPELTRILGDDRYYLDHENIANGLADLGWGKLVPDIIKRLEKDYAGNVKLFGREGEFYSPSLPKLTGKAYGENPRLWREWLDREGKEYLETTDPS